MKIKLFVFSMFLFGGSNCYGQNHNGNLPESLVDNIMLMWTKIDTVRAINTDCGQKNMFLEDLINDSFDAYYLSRQIKRLPDISNAGYDQDVIDLVTSVKKSFEEVFYPVNNSDFYVFCFVLQKIVSLLKAPENIQPNIPA